jgi:hypothetical protein
MKPRHAAVLALVGWYLLIPPVTKNTAHPDAPLSKWQKFGTFDSVKDCESHAVEWNNMLPAEQFKLKMPKDATAQCFASDAPRLAK